MPSAEARRLPQHVSTHASPAGAGSIDAAGEHGHGVRQQVPVAKGCFYNLFLAEALKKTPDQGI